MATKKTSMFTLTERLTISAGATETTATIDLASYVDVADRQGLQVHSVDYVFQGQTAASDITTDLGAGREVTVQVTDLNRGGLVFANDRALVSSGRLNCDSQQGLQMDSDLYPDNYGKGSDDGRYVVNDQLYITGLATAITNPINVTVRVNASVVSLTAKDFMAIAIQSTAADN
jgi:hypothetical protein